MDGAYSPRLLIQLVTWLHKEPKHTAVQFNQARSAARSVHENKNEINRQPQTTRAKDS